MSEIWERLDAFPGVTQMGSRLYDMSWSNSQMPQAAMESQGVLVSRDHMTTSRHMLEGFLAWGDRVVVWAEDLKKPFQYKRFTRDIPKPKNSE